MHFSPKDQFIFAKCFSYLSSYFLFVLNCPMNLSLIAVFLFFSCSKHDIKCLSETHINFFNFYTIITLLSAALKNLVYQQEGPFNSEIKLSFLFFYDFVCLNPKYEKDESTAFIFLRHVTINIKKPTQIEWAFTFKSIDLRN